MGEGPARERYSIGDCRVPGHDREVELVQLTDEQTRIVERDVDDIITACRALDPHLIAVVLGGPFARGEGGWYTNADNKLVQLGTYEVLIITPSPPVRKLLVDTAASLSREGLRSVSLNAAKPRLLERLKPSPYSYDLKYSARVLYGPEDVLKRIPLFAARDLTDDAARVFFFYRVRCLLDGFEKGGGPDKAMTGESLAFFPPPDGPCATGRNRRVPHAAQTFRTDH